MAKSSKGMVTPVQRPIGGKSTGKPMIVGTRKMKGKR